MSGFEFTPDGIAPLGVSHVVQKTGDVASASVAVQDPDFVPPNAQMFLPGATSMRIDKTGITIGPAAKPLKPKDVVKLAKSRLKEVNREIARLHKLERERDELKRLIDAADGRPVALVRSLPTRSA